MTSQKFEDGRTYQKVGSYPFRFGSNEYHRYKGDIALFAEMGMRVYRFSIGWAGICPSGDDGKPNQAGIEYYKNVFKECHKRHIKVSVTTLHHATPAHLVDTYGRRRNRKLMDFYLRYAKTLFEDLKNDVDY